MKETLKTLPVTVWVIFALMLAVGVYAAYDYIDAFIESVYQSRFESNDAKKQEQNDKLKMERDVYIEKAKNHEAREILLSTEVEALRQAIAKKSTKNADEKIKASEEIYIDDREVIQKFKNGEMTPLEFCNWQCNRYKNSGYPCRPNYCDQYK